MTTTAELRAIYTSEMDQLETHAPEDREQFCLSVRVMVGPKGGEGEESFDINVCTPKWLAERCQKDGFVLGRHYLIVGRYDVPFIKNVIADLVQRCIGNSWHDVAEKLSRIGYWEFEDYKPATQR